jgi:hypothetical protein
MQARPEVRCPNLGHVLIKLTVDALILVVRIFNGTNGNRGLVGQENAVLSLGEEVKRK